MREIRLCDDCSFEETIKKCVDNNVGIELQTFHNLVAKEDESPEEFNKRINLEIEKEQLIFGIIF